MGTSIDQNDVEVRIIEAYRAGTWNSAADFPGCSMSEHITIALALGLHDLLPANWVDPLDAYRVRLNDRQRAIVDHYRS